MSKLVVGAWVRCERDAPAKGTWPRYAGRVGRIATFNREGGEWGVAFTRPDTQLEDLRTEAWFLSSELVPVDAPHSRRAVSVSDETTVGGHP